MARKGIDSSESVVERNLALTRQVMQYLLDRPQVFEVLPAHFELVLLPDDDPEMRRYNLDLLDKFESQKQPIVFARIKSQKTDALTRQTPRIFVPVAM